MSIRKRFRVMCIYPSSRRIAIKILQITAYYPPSLGGIQIYSEQLSHHLSQLGHQVDVLTVNTDQAPALEMNGNHRVIRCKRDAGLYRAVLSSELLSRLWSARDYDVYHIHIPFHLGFEAALLAARRNRIPLVATHHGQGLRGSPFYTLVAQTYAWFQQKISLCGVGALILLSQSYADSLSLAGCARSKTKIVTTGADIERFTPTQDRMVIRAAYGLTANTPLVLFVGYLGKSNRYKGCDFLIQAMQQVVKTVQDAHLIIVGGGDLLPELQASAASSSAASNVIFAGAVHHDQLPAYYAAADVLALPSISGPENAPVVIFEAMASARPVVASDLPGVREIVRDGQTGRLVAVKDTRALANALIEFLCDADLRAAFGQNARRFAELHSWQACAGQMERIYVDLTRSKH